MDFTLLYLPNFLRTILILICIYYGFKLFQKYVAPYLLNKAVEKLSQKMQNGGFQNSGAQSQQRRTEGDVKVEGARKKSNSSTKSKDGGDYVDFEEIR